MSTIFVGEGNIGLVEVKPFVDGNKEPRFLLRMGVYFDNPVKVKEKFEDKGGFWADVELWMGEDAKKWSVIYQKGQRVLVQGKMVRNDWKDEATGSDKFAFKVRARRVGVLPFRVESITMRSSTEKVDHNEPFPAESEFDDIPF
ncbi:MAG: single-stranded DNA-binding protein [Betaproteobacteria bacterium]|nr:single-stranded DNA-binding protein [Betaproteobacteria bacterium]